MASELDQIAEEFGDFMEQATAKSECHVCGNEHWLAFPPEEEERKTPSVATRITLIRSKCGVIREHSWNVFTQWRESSDKTYSDDDKEWL